MISIPLPPVELTIPNNALFLPTINVVLKENAKIRGFGKDNINQIELAVEEAVTHILEYAFEEEEQTSFKISFHHTPLGLDIKLKDKGVPFDPNKIPDYDPNTLNEKSPLEGLGWYIMERSVDEVIFNNLGTEGKELHLIKHLPQQPIEALKEEKVPDESLIQSRGAFPPKSIAFEVRKAQASDAIEIAKCAYDVYGYSYVFENIYYPKRWAELIDNGDVYSALAKTKDGNIMSHGALIFENKEDKVAEMGIFLTLGKYQNQGCGKKISAHLIKQAIMMGLNGISGRSTTIHPYSQKGAHKSGARDCCILIGYSPVYNFKHFEEQKSRLTFIHSYLSLKISSYLKIGQKRKEIFVPEHHARMVEKIYKHLGMKVKLMKAAKNQAEPALEDSILKISTDNKALAVKFEVKMYGKDILQLIRRMLKKLCVDKYEFFMLVLNLKDPLTAKYIPSFEDMGFFFGGIMPGAKSGDKLVLQYLNNVLVDYENIQIYADFTKELLDYIKERDPIQTALST